MNLKDGEPVHSKKAGAPTKFSERLVKALCDAVELGCSDREAAAIAGIHPTTLCVWRKRYPELVGRMERAEARGMENRLRTISEAAEKNPKWAAWILEHRWPEKWSRANRGQVAVHIGGQTQIAVIDQSMCQQISDSWAKFESGHLKSG